MADEELDWPDETPRGSELRFRPVTVPTDLGEERPSCSPNDGKELGFSPARARFTGKVLVGVGIIYAFTAICYMVMVCHSHTKQAVIFADLLKTIIPSLASLVLGIVIHERVR